MTTATSISRANVFVRGLLIGALLISLAESRPRWEDPCDLLRNNGPGLFQRFLGALRTASPEELCADMRTATRAAYRQASQLLSEYGRELVGFRARIEGKSLEVEESFKDDFFIEGTASHRLNWLPKVDPDFVKGMDLATLVPYYYNKLQYYAVGIEQIYMDQVVYEGKWFIEFRETEANVMQVLCTLQMGMRTLGVHANPDVTRDVMQQQYRQIASHSQRLIRNYLILRDYVRLLREILNTLDDTARTLSSGDT